MTSFTWVDGERTVRFARGALGEAPELLAARGFIRYALVTTERAEDACPGLVDGAEVVLHVPPGPVPDAAAAVRPGVQGHPLVAVGGGRVIDAAKAVAGADGLTCAAVPTTLAGSPLTPFHRMPAGVSAVHLVRPALVVWDPDLIATLPRQRLAATGLNALAHAFESLYTPLANPVSELAALRAAALFERELPHDRPDPERVSLAALLAGYAVGATGFAVHHALCQTVVRKRRLPHAQVNALVLPHTAALMAGRAPGAVGRFAEALGDPNGEPVNAPGRIARLTAHTDLEGLDELGLEEDELPELARAATQHPAMANTPGGVPAEAELLDVLRAAL